MRRAAVIACVVGTLTIVPFAEAQQQQGITGALGGRNPGSGTLTPGIGSGTGLLPAPPIDSTITPGIDPSTTGALGTGTGSFGVSPGSGLSGAQPGTGTFGSATGPSLGTIGGFRSPTSGFPTVGPPPSTSFGTPNSSFGTTPFGAPPGSATTPGPGR